MSKFFRLNIVILFLITLIFKNSLYIGLNAAPVYKATSNHDQLNSMGINYAVRDARSKYNHSAEYYATESKTLSTLLWSLIPSSLALGGLSAYLGISLSGNDDEVIPKETGEIFTSDGLNIVLGDNVGGATTPFVAVEVTDSNYSNNGEVNMSAINNINSNLYNLTTFLITNGSVKNIGDINIDYGDNTGATPSINGNYETAVFIANNGTINQSGNIVQNTGGNNAFGDYTTIIFETTNGSTININGSINSTSSVNIGDTDYITGIYDVTNTNVDMKGDINTISDDNIGDGNYVTNIINSVNSNINLTGHINLVTGNNNRDGNYTTSIISNSGGTIDLVGNIDVSTGANSGNGNYTTSIISNSGGTIDLVGNIDVSTGANSGNGNYTTSIIDNSGGGTINLTGNIDVSTGANNGNGSYTTDIITSRDGVLNIVDDINISTGDNNADFDYTVYAINSLNDTIELNGNLILNSGDNVGSGDYIVYGIDVNSGSINALDNISLTAGSNNGSGNYIVYALNLTNESINTTNDILITTGNSNGDGNYTVSGLIINDLGTNTVDRKGDIAINAGSNIGSNGTINVIGIDINNSKGGSITNTGNIVMTGGSNSYKYSITGINTLNSSIEQSGNISIKTGVAHGVQSGDTYLLKGINSDNSSITLFGNINIENSGNDNGLSLGAFEMYGIYATSGSSINSESNISLTSSSISGTQGDTAVMAGIYVNNSNLSNIGNLNINKNGNVNGGNGLNITGIQVVNNSNTNITGNTTINGGNINNGIVNIVGIDTTSNSNLDYTGDLDINVNGLSTNTAKLNITAVTVTGNSTLDMKGDIDIKVGDFQNANVSVTGIIIDSSIVGFDGNINMELTGSSSNGVYDSVTGILVNDADVTIGGSLTIYSPHAFYGNPVVKGLDISGNSSIKIYSDILIINGGGNHNVEATIFGVTATDNSYIKNYGTVTIESKNDSDPSSPIINTYISGVRLYDNSIFINEPNSFIDVEVERDSFNSNNYRSYTVGMSDSSQFVNYGTLKFTQVGRGAANIVYIDSSASASFTNYGDMYYSGSSVSCGNATGCISVVVPFSTSSTLSSGVVYGSTGSTFTNDGYIEMSSTDNSSENVILNYCAGGVVCDGDGEVNSSESVIVVDEGSTLLIENDTQFNVDGDIYVSKDVKVSNSVNGDFQDTYTVTNTFNATGEVKTESGWGEANSLLYSSTAKVNADGSTTIEMTKTSTFNDHIASEFSVAVDDSIAQGYGYDTAGTYDISLSNGYAYSTATQLEGNVYSSISRIKEQESFKVVNMTDILASDKNYLLIKDDQGIATAGVKIDDNSSIRAIIDINYNRYTSDINDDAYDYHSGTLIGGLAYNYKINAIDSISVSEMYSGTATTYGDNSNSELSDRASYTSVVYNRNREEGMNYKAMLSYGYTVSNMNRKVYDGNRTLNYNSDYDGHTLFGEFKAGYKYKVNKLITVEPEFKLNGGMYQHGNIAESGDDVALLNIGSNQVYSILPNIGINSKFKKDDFGLGLNVAYNYELGNIYSSNESVYYSDLRTTKELGKNDYSKYGNNNFMLDVKADYTILKSINIFAAYHYEIRHNYQNVDLGFSFGW